MWPRASRHETSRLYGTRCAPDSGRVIRVVAPLTDLVARERVMVAPLPLADALCALWLIANDHPGTPRLTALRDRLTVQETRIIAAWFGPPLPLGLLALGLAATEDRWAGLRTALRDASDIDTIAFALAGTRTADAPDSPGVYRSLMLDAEWAREYIRRYLVPAPADPAPLLAAIADPADARGRLIDALASLFAAHLTPLLPDITEESEDAAARLDVAFIATPARFVAQHVPLAATPDAETPVVCWPSVFLAVGSVVFPALASGDTLVAIGAAEIPGTPEPASFTPVTATAATYQDVYRLLADPVRWEIVRLLVAAPRYGQELAERLELSIATVSHHLNGLKKLELVDIIRAEHRLYYHLRVTRLRGLLAGAEHGLLDTLA